MGDLVIINEDEDFVAEQSRKILLTGQVVCNEEIVRSMLGNTYPVVQTVSKLLTFYNWVNLLNDDGKRCYFPSTTLRKVERSKWTYICSYY